MAEQIYEVQKALGKTAGLDVNLDNFHRGYIQGVSDMLEVDLGEDSDD